MRRMMLIFAAVVVVAALATLRTADAQPAEDLTRRIVLLQERIGALESQVGQLSQQLAELRGPIRVTAHGVEIRTGDFTVLAGAKILLRATGDIELRGSKVSQN